MSGKVILEHEGFLTTSTAARESQLFLESGHFNSDLGDTILLALSNALGLPIIVFSSIQSHSVINIVPWHLKTAAPIHLAYLQHGVGHYDVAHPAQNCQSCNSAPLSVQLYCTCGKKLRHWCHWKHCCHWGH